MHIRTFFHNVHFLRNGCLKADARTARKAGRRLVCVLVLLVCTAGAAWGAEYRWKPEGDTTGTREWSTVSNWESAVLPNGDSSDVPGGDDRVFIRGSGTETVIKLTGETSLDELIINSDNAGSHVVRIIAENPTVFNIIKLYLALPGDASAFTLILEDVSLSCTTIEVNNDTNNHKNGGEFIISGTGSSSISATTVNVYADAASSPGSMKIDFGNVPMTATNVNVNAAEKTGTVEIATDSSITVNDRMNIGKYDQNGSNNTKTVFSGSGSVTTKTLDFPNAHNHELTIEEGVALGFSSGGTFYQDTSGSITINGSGTIDFQNAGIDTTNNDKPQGLHISPDTIVLNPPGNNTYTMTVDTMSGFPSSSVQSVTIRIEASTEESSLNDRYKKFLYTFSQNGNQFTFNENTNASSQIQLSSGSGNSYSGEFTLSYNNSGLSAGNGFTLTIYRPDGIVLGTVSWYQGVPGWTGDSSTAWNTLGNWTGITDLGDLSTKDISINSSAQNQPKISTDVQVKTLTITNNATVTQTEGSFSVESITCQGTGKFIDDGGTVQFNGSDGTYSAVYNGDTYFNNVSIESGKKLTLNSDLYLKGNLTVNGTLTQNGKSLVFCGSSSQSISGVTSLDAITVKNGARVTLGADFTVGKLTVESGGTLDCSGHTLTITDSSTIAGTVTAEKCIATGIGGKTLTINGTLSVSDTLTLEGTDADHKLVITGGGIIKLAASQTGGKWLDVTYGTVPVVHDSSDGTTVTYTASYSSGPATNPTGWKIFSGASAYTWTGNAGSNDWGTAGNWDVNAVPNENSDVVLNEDAECETPAGTAVTVKTLTLTDGTAMITLLGDLTVTESITNDGCLDTNGHKLTFKTYDSPTEDGLVVVSGASSLVPTTSETSAGTITWLEFAGDTTFENVSKLTFVNANVSVLAPATSTVVTLSGDLTFTGELNNASVIDTNGHTLTFKEYHDTTSAVVKIGAAGGIALYTGDSAQTISNVEFTGNRTFTDSTSFSFVNATVDSGVELTLVSLAARSNVITFGGTVINNGTVTLSGSSLTAKKYAGTGGFTISGLITLKSTGADASASGAISSVTSSETTTISQSGFFTIGAFTVSGGTLRMNSDLTLTGLLSNTGTVNTNSHKLTFGSYSDTSALGTALVQIAADNALALYSGGTGGEIKNLEFTGSSSFKDLSGLTIRNVTVNSGVELKMIGGCTFGGTLENKGTINLNQHQLSFAAYTHTGTVQDKVLSNGGKIVSTGGGTGTASISTVQVSTGLSVTNNGSGDLKLASTEFSGAASLTVGSGSGSAPVFTSVKVTSGILTLNSPLTAVSINNNGKIKLSGNNLSWSSAYNGKSDGTDEVIASGTVTVGPTGSGTGTIGVFSVSDTAMIGGVFSCKKFTGTGLGGKTLTINGTVTVGSGTTGNAAAQTLQLSGTDGNPLVISGNGSGTINLNASQVGGNFLDVTSSGPSISFAGGGAYTATNSTGTAPSGWIICSGDIVYTWTGLTDSTWQTPSNWNVYVAPDTVNEVIIGVVASNNYPVTPSTATTLGKLTVAFGANLTLGGNLTVTGVLSNEGTINTNGKTLTFSSYTDTSALGTGLVQIAGDNALTLSAGGSDSTIKNIKFTESCSFGVTSLSFVNATIPAGKTVKLTENLTLSGILSNEGTINTNGQELKFASYTDTSATGTGIIQIAGNNALALYTGGTGGTIKKIEFTGNSTYSTITNLSVKDAEVKAGTLTAGNSLVFTGTFTNDGSVLLSDYNLKAEKYAGSGPYRVAGSVTIESTGADTSASGAVETVQSSTATTFTQTGFYKINNLKVNASTLTLASNISAGNVTIEGGATLNADSRASDPAADSADPSNPVYGCTTFGGGYVLTVSGNFINYNTGHSNATPYPGFVAQHGRVEITGNGTHEIRGNNKFHDFVCISPGATLIFDANKTTNVDHQIWLEGSGSNLITLKTDNAAEGDKWTLDVIWSDVDGTAEHRKPHISYVAPHKSRSYSAKLKGCLVGCVDDAPNLRDSTNVNWFDDMPTIIMTLAPVGGKQLAVMFSSEVDAVSGTDLRTSVALKTNTGSNLIDPSVPVSMYTGSSDKSKTTVVFGLTRELTWNDLFGSDCLHVEVIQSGAVLVRGTNIKYQQGVKHCASDFAINAARMLFGYDNYIDSSTPLTIEKGSNSVRTWDQSDPISNRLHSDSDLLFQAQFDASVPTGMKLEMVAMLDSQLNKSIISDNYMDYYGLSTRLWLPTQFQPISTAQQSVPSSQMISQDSTSSGRLRNFSLHYSKTSSSPLFQMKDGEEIQFLFKVKNSDNSDLSVDHDYVFENGVFTPVSGPVYAIRLKDDADITSFDLWSVMLEATKLQRGNVTILNNVINSDQKEETFVTIQMQKAGSLTVQVLTLDGSVITTLQRGRKAAGTYGYSWDGTNGKGKAVARGMYFIRVIGPDIDETRKVMVVRD